MLLWHPILVYNSHNRRNGYEIVKAIVWKSRNSKEGKRRGIGDEVMDTITKIEALTEADGKTELEKRRSARRKRKKQNKRIRLILLVVVALVIGIVAAILFFGNQPQKEKEIGKLIEGIPVTVDLLEKGTPARPGQTRKIEYIVIHETGNSGTNANAASHNQYLHKVSTTEALSWHYTVDDSSIYKHLPDTEIGFHAGDKLVQDGGNLNGIGIEMCINPENNYEQTLLNTAALVRYLMDAYNLDIKQVKKHEDFSGKICPEGLIQSGRWEEFINLI